MSDLITSNSRELKRINSLYMHTLNDKPAFYDPKEKLIFYAANGQATLFGKRNRIFAESLRDIKKQQRADQKTVLAMGGSDEYKGKRGYLRVRIG